jgi:hypothetical protein
MLKFKCPECGSEELKVVETDVILSQKIISIDEDCLNYDSIIIEHEEIDCYKCCNCEFVLTNGILVIQDEKEVIEWLKKHCEPGK